MNHESELKQTLLYAEDALDEDNKIIAADQIDNTIHTLYQTINETLSWEASGNDDHATLHTLTFNRRIHSTPKHLLPFTNDSLLAGEQLTLNHHVYDDDLPSQSYTSHTKRHHYRRRLFNAPGCRGRLRNLLYQETGVEPSQDYFQPQLS